MLKSKSSGVDLEEQNQILIKHLVNKTGVQPKPFEEGYLFSFKSFKMIDNNLEILSKVLMSSAPVNYIICVQILDNAKKSAEQLKILISLKFLNKIAAMNNTAYRYQFNNNKKYRTTSLGIYQKNGNSFEIQEFISND